MVEVKMAVNSRRVLYYALRARVHPYNVIAHFTQSHENHCRGQDFGRDD